MEEASRCLTSKASVEQLARGEALGRYIVIERLGEGATGVVYAAYDPELDRKVALKILRRPDGDAGESRRQARFVREAKAIAKLAHPNVVGIFDVGVDNGRVFLAMEYLTGGTLRDWMATQGRPWRDVVKMFVAVGKGLAAAHTEGLVHRDFKPDNVLLDRTGTPKVADFGLARLSGPSTEDSFAEVSYQETPRTDARVTRTGAMTGTPAYMAPEQFRGKATDGRTDQFAFSVALYEALYGRRPFAAETVFDLAEAVIRERIEPAPKNASVPGWIRRSLLRGLHADSAQRYARIEELLSALEADPVARVRRIFVISAVAVILVGTLAGLYRRSEQRRIEFERRVATKLGEGHQALADAAAMKRRLDVDRRRAFAAFDDAHNQEGEVTWTEARAEASKLESTLKRAQAVLEAALALDQTNEPAREALGQALFERAQLAELEFRTADLTHHVEQLQRLDTGGRAIALWTRPGSVDIRTTPAGAQLVLERYELGVDDGNHLIPIPVSGPFTSPSGVRTLPSGSYRVTATKAGFVETRYPFLVKRGQAEQFDIRLVPAGEVPADFVYVPEGRFLYGDADEDWRLGFLNAAPIHERVAPAFFIKAHETTFGEWLEFLRDLPPAERRLRTPSSVAVQGSVVLRQSTNAVWSLELNISGPKTKARESLPIVYPTRHVRASQDWLRMPVLGISPKDMEAYFEWLSRTDRVRGARFCSELEWERAARGADGRVYPAAQSRVTSEDANIDVTYGRVRGSFGPDEVGSHPRSRSPFGVDDMTGNSWEAVTATEGGEYVVRGGSYYHSGTSARLTNREGIDKESRSYVLGVRVCAAIE
jgi:formylglycine-generating enzyme required for sulfatase activity